MALLYMDSFDHYATADLAEKWTNTGLAGTGSTTTIEATSGRRSSGAWRWTTGTTATAAGFVRKTLTPSGATVVIGFAFRTSGVGAVAGTAGLQILSFQDGASAQFYLRLNQDLTLSLVRGQHGLGTVLGTTAATLSSGTYAYLELKVLIANSGGTVELRIDGTPRLTLTGQDTQNTAAAQWTSFWLGQGENPVLANAATRDLDFDDLYVLDGNGASPWNTFLGDCRVDALLPTGPGATTAWTPSAGANWQCVDDAAPNDDTDYVYAATALTDTYTCADHPVVGAPTIYGVQHALHVKKTDTGACTVAPVVRSGGVDYVGANLSPGTAYGYLLQIAATNPATATPWTVAAVNTAEFGVKRTT